MEGHHGFDLWAELERVVTPENVNRIPDDWNPPELDLEMGLGISLNYIKREARYEGEDGGFLRFLICWIFRDNPALVYRFVEQWAPYIEWTYDSDTAYDGLKMRRKHWLESHLHHHADLALFLFKHGCPCPEDYMPLSHILYPKTFAKPSADKTALLLWLMDNNRLDLGWTKGPTWLNDFCQRYKWRRARCQRVALIICGISKRSPYFQRSRDMARMLARYVWCTRRAEGWLDQRQIKKIQP